MEATPDVRPHRALLQGSSYGVREGFRREARRVWSESMPPRLYRIPLRMPKDGEYYLRRTSLEQQSHALEGPPELQDHGNSG